MSELSDSEKAAIRRFALDFVVRSGLSVGSVEKVIEAASEIADFVIDGVRPSDGTNEKGN